MYEVYIYEEQKKEVYDKLIDYAMSKSDTFMNITRRYKNIKEDDKNNIIFNQSIEVFLNKLTPYLIKKRNYPTEWPSTRAIQSKFETIDICVYGICKSIRKYLLQPEGLFNWRYPYYPEDLCFFKKGYCWFLVIAHEEQANICRNYRRGRKIKENWIKRF